MIQELLKEISKKSATEQRCFAQNVIRIIAEYAGGDIHGAVAIIELAKFELMFDVNNRGKENYKDIDDLLKN